MSELTMIGLDIAKNMFHAVGIDAVNETRLRRKLRRSQVKGFFRKQPPLPDRHRSLWFCTLLGQAIQCHGTRR
jgi:hypothetical protein